MTPTPDGADIVAAQDTTIRPSTQRRPSTQAQVDRVCAVLKDSIKSGELPSGSRLTGETELARRLGVSRPVIRAALRNLRESGLVYSRQGSGTYVRVRQETPAESSGFSAVQSIADIQRAFEFRLTIETGGAAFAARRRNAETLDAMSEAIGMMERAAPDDPDRMRADFLFHRAIAEASNNHYYGACLDALCGLAFPQKPVEGVSLPRSTAEAAIALDEHRGLFEAIRGGDPDRARDLMRAHLTGACHRLFGGRTLNLSL